MYCILFNMYHIFITIILQLELSLNIQSEFNNKIILILIFVNWILFAYQLKKVIPVILSLLMDY